MRFISIIFTIMHFCVFAEKIHVDDVFVIYYEDLNIAQYNIELKKHGIQNFKNIHAQYKDLTLKKNDIALSSSQLQNLVNLAQKNEIYNASYNNTQICYKVDDIKLSRCDIVEAITHLQCMKNFISSNKQHCMILESNASFIQQKSTKKFIKNINNIITKTPADFDVLFLDIGIYTLDKEPYFYTNADYLRSFKNIAQNNQIVQLTQDNNAFGMHAYIISRKGAEKILHSAQILSTPLDCLITRGIPGLKVYVARNKIINVKNCDSVRMKFGAVYAKPDPLSSDVKNLHQHTGEFNE